MRRTTGALILAAALLAGCETTQTPQPAPATPTPASAVPAPPSEPAPVAAPAPPPDTCGAGALAGLVGRPRSEIPIPTDLTRRRVVCTACPMTQDFRPDRQTILYDAATNRVTAVRCG